MMTDMMTDNSVYLFLPHKHILLCQQLFVLFFVILHRKFVMY